MTDGEIKKSLELCPACKMPYARERNPEGCPICRADPSKGRTFMRQAAEQDNADRRSTLLFKYLIITAIVIGVIIWVSYLFIGMNEADKLTDNASQIIKNQSETARQQERIRQLVRPPPFQPPPPGR